MILFRVFCICVSPMIEKTLNTQFDRKMSTTVFVKNLQNKHNHFVANAYELFVYI